MKRYCLLMLALLLSVTAFSASADITIGENCIIEFASKKQANKLLSQKDDYTARLSQFDLTAKMQRKKVASKKQFLAFARKQGVQWNDQEKEKLTSIIQRLRFAMAPYAEFLPEKIYLVKTTGLLESGAFYTRGNSIFIPQQNVARSTELLTTVMVHEFFHLITRKDPQLRDRLYAAIGFAKSPELVLPESLRNRKISNPDVPILTHLIKIKIDGKNHWATPLIYASRDYDRTVKRVFFQYLELGMLAYHWDGESNPQAVMGGW